MPNSPRGRMSSSGGCATIRLQSDHEMEVRPLEPIELARIIVDLASDKKGENVVLMDMRQVSPITDFFIIVSGTSDRQLKAIIEHIAQELKKTHNIRPWRTEGA